MPLLCREMPHFYAVLFCNVIFLFFVLRGFVRHGSEWATNNLYGIFIILSILKKTLVRVHVFCLTPSLCKGEGEVTHST